MGLTAAEQYAIELLNRARLDPAGEARRYGVDLNYGLPSTMHISTAPKQALAPNAVIEAAALRHGDWLRVRDFRLDRDDNRDGIPDAHYEGTDASGKYYDPGDRMAAAGYIFSGSSSWGENLAFISSASGAIAAHHAGWMRSAGHRYNMLTESFTDIGFAQVTGEYLGYNGSSLAVQNFASSGSRAYVTGVAYTDRDKDNFYSIGEGRGSLAMAIVGGDAEKTEAAGGYALAAKAGSEVTVRIGTSTQVKVDLADGNVKLDVVNGNLLKVSGDVTLVSGSVKNITGLGVGNFELIGNDLANVLTGSAGRNYLAGAGGNDALKGMAGNDALSGGAGADTLSGSTGNDRLNGGAGRDALWGGTGADVFVLTRGGDGDRANDFGAGDRMALDDALWGGGLSKLGVVKEFAKVTSAGVLFDFGHGDSLLLAGMRSLSGLADRIDFI